jgi:5-methylcytosine-specific restriction endonuclease McrA
MAGRVRQDRSWLLATAKAVAKQLKPHSKGTGLRLRIPSHATMTNTDGWRVIIGDLGKNQPRLEIWLDRFAGYPERKLYACFRSEVRSQLVTITKHISKTLWPVRIITLADTEDEKYVVLAKRLRRSEFHAPILEKYSNEETFFGIYDLTRETAEKINPHFCNRAVAFFEDVARGLPQAAAEDEQREVYPQQENRKLVVSHLKRERSRLLATERKILDNYQCQVCGLRFEEVYGTLGQGYAEAHHLIPLSQLQDNVKTSIDDLRTVCANCHRMLHRMSGTRNDINKLKAIYRKHAK